MLRLVLISNLCLTQIRNFIYRQVTWLVLGVPQVVCAWTLIRFQQLVLLLDPCKFLQPKGVQIAPVPERYPIRRHVPSNSFANIRNRLISIAISSVINCLSLGYVSNLPLHWDEDGKWTWPENWSIWLIMEDLYFHFKFSNGLSFRTKYIWIRNKAKKLVTFYSVRIIDPNSILIEYNVILLIQSRRLFFFLIHIKTGLGHKIRLNL